MITHKTRWWLVRLVRLALWPAHPSAQGDLWETYMAAATKAYQQGNYPEAEKPLEAAVKEAEGIGPQDPRLATSLNNLAEVYRLEEPVRQGRAASPAGTSDPGGGPGAGTPRRGHGPQRLGTGLRSPGQVRRG